MGSVGDLTAADEQLRNLAEAIGGSNNTPTGFLHNKDSISPGNRDEFMLPTFRGSTISNPTGSAGGQENDDRHLMRTKNSSSNRRARRQNSAEAKKGTKYTLIDLVDNINTDVKSDVADFDF